MNFFQKLEEKQKENNSLVCVGLDIDLDKMPSHILRTNPKHDLREVEKSGSSRLRSNNIEKIIFEFNKQIIDETKDLACVYKPNIAFYEVLGIEGLKSLKKTVEYIHSLDMPVIVDAKRNDIGNTAKAYAKGMFDFFEFDAMTVNPYMGTDTIAPFLEYKDKGVFILTRTSNPGAKDFEELQCENKPLFHHILEKTLEIDKSGTAGFVVGATSPNELKEARELAPKSTFLIPGISAQGGDTESTIKLGTREDGLGAIINSSRGIIFASSGEDFAEAAREATKKLRDEINKYRR